MCGRAYSPRFLWMWPNARISVMGGEQAVTCAGAPRQSRRARHRVASQRPRRAFKARGEIRETQTARLWDDGVIDPADTRTVLELALSVTANAPVEPVSHGVFRM